MNKLVPFDFGPSPVRVILADGEPWFMARDVAVALGYSNPLEAIRTHCKTTREISATTASGEQRIRVIAERDVYRLILRSKLPAAEQFEEWVVANVLPKIRATGRYNAPAACDLGNPQALRTALIGYTEKVIALEQTIERQAPAVEFARAVRGMTDTIKVGDMARLLGQGQNRFFQRLRADQILMADNRPYQAYIDRGYFRVAESVWHDADGTAHPTFKTLVTGRGQVFLQRRYGASTGTAV